MIIPLSFIFLSCHEKAHDNNQFCPEISKPFRESWPIKPNPVFWLTVFSLVSQSVFVNKFASVNLASKTPAAKVLNSGVVTHLSWLWSVSYFSISVIFVL